jgi:hypothetical protein
VKLSTLFVKNAGPGKYEDGNGLRLVKRADGGGQWVFRYMLLGRRREMGIGGLTSISLKEAREIPQPLEGVPDEIIPFPDYEPFAITEEEFV